MVSLGLGLGLGFLRLLLLLRMTAEPGRNGVCKWKQTDEMRCSCIQSHFHMIVVAIQEESRVGHLIPLLFQSQKSSLGSSSSPQDYTASWLELHYAPSHHVTIIHHIVHAVADGYGNAVRGYGTGTAHGNDYGGQTEEVNTAGGAKIGPFESSPLRPRHAK